MSVYYRICVFCSYVLCSLKCETLCTQMLMCFNKLLLTLTFDFENTHAFSDENPFTKVACKNSAILFKSQCVNHMLNTATRDLRYLSIHHMIGHLQNMQTPFSSIDSKLVCKIFLLQFSKLIYFWRLSDMSLRALMRLKWWLQRTCDWRSRTMSQLKPFYRTALHRLWLGDGCAASQSVAML